jgi:hypothetical protein
LRLSRPAPFRPRTVAIAVVVAITIVGLALPLLIADHGGAIGIARNDDWSYLRALFHWRDTGHLDFNHWVSMTLLGQLVIARPVVSVFGDDITAVQVLTAVLGLVGLFAILWLGVLMTGRTGVAGLLALTVAASPLWGPLAVSFMTDVPAFALAMVACALGVRAFRGDQVSLPFLVGGLIMAFVGFTIRQYVAVPFVALALVSAPALRREAHRRSFVTFLGVTAVLTIGAFAVLAFWRTIPNLKPVDPALPTAHSVRVTIDKGVGLFRLTGLMLAPVLCFLGPVQILRRAKAMTTPATTAVAIAAGVALVITAVAEPRIAFAGNYVTPNGALSGEVVHGLRPDILPFGGWWLLVMVATLASIVLVAALVPALVDLEHLARHRGRARHRESSVLLVELAVAGYTVAYALASLLGLPIGDRYVLPVVPLVGLLLVGRSTHFAEAVVATNAPRREHRVLAACAVVFVGCIGVVFTIDSASFDGTRWRVATAATHAGWSADQVDGGFEWNNFHPASAPVPTTGRATPRCVTVRLNPPGGIHAPRVVAFGYYRSPLVDPVAAVAARGDVACSPARRP